MHRFVSGFKRPWTREGATNVGPSYRFIYQNNAPASLSRNLDSAEYSNMTLHFLYWYDCALQAGMQPLPARGPAAAARLGPARPLRLLDPRRLHELGHGLELRALDEGQGVGLRPAGPAGDRDRRREFQLRTPDGRAAPSTSSTAGLQLYDHLGDQPPGRPFRPSAQLYGIGDQGAPATKMFWARMAANAARAVSAGMGADAGRAPAAVLLVRRRHRPARGLPPRYSTAVLAVNRGKVPYGGADLARLTTPTATRSADRRAPARLLRRADHAPGRRATFATQRGLHTRPDAAAARAHPLAARARDPPAAPGDPAGRRARSGRLDETLDRAATASASPPRTPSGATRSAPGTRSRARAGRSCAASASCCRPRAGPTAASRRAARRAQIVRVTAGRPCGCRTSCRFHLRSPHGSYRAVINGAVRGTTSVFAPRQRPVQPARRADARPRAAGAEARACAGSSSSCCRRRAAGRCRTPRRRRSRTRRRPRRRTPSRRPEAVARPTGFTVGEPGSGIQVTTLTASDTLTVLDPRTGDPIDELPVATGAQVAAAVARAREAQRAWARAAPAERGAAAKAAARSLREHLDELAELTERETGKPAGDARGGVEAGIGTLEQYAELGPLHRGRTLQGVRRRLRRHGPRAARRRGGADALERPRRHRLPADRRQCRGRQRRGVQAVREDAAGRRARRELIAEQLPDGVLCVLHGDGRVGRPWRPIPAST